MPRRTLALFALIIPLLSLAIAPLVIVHAAAYSLLASSVVPGSDDVKFPQVTANGSTVSVSGNANKRDAFLWEKAAAAGSFGNATYLGVAGGQPDYSITHVVYSPNGSLFYLWTNINERRIYMRVRPAGAADFGPSTVVVASPGLPFHFDVVARSDTEAFVFYRDFYVDSFVPLRYVVVGVVGNTSAPIASGVVESNVIQPTGPRAAVGPHGEVAVGYSLANGKDSNYQAWVAIWNGSGWDRANVSEPNGGYGDPMPVITPDGKYYVTYRGIGEGTDGTYFSERQSDGSWPISRLQKGETKWTSMVSDAYGNLHLFYMNYLSGSPRLYYAVKPANQGFESTFDSGVGNYYNVDGAASTGDLVYGHAVAEDFTGSKGQMRYFLFRSDLIGVNAGSISVDGGQQYTKKTSLPVTFSNVVGDQGQMQVRYHWGAPPSDADAWTAFSNPLTVTGPTLTDQSACSEQILYTQLRVGSAVQATPNQDAIVFDRAAQARVLVVNPNSAYDPAYTASAQALLKVDSWGECIGLSGGTVSGDISPASQNLTINNNRSFQQSLALSGGEGQKTLTVNVSDLLGNASGNLQRTIIYDATKPVQSAAGTVTVTPDPTDPVTNIFAELKISGAKVTEDERLYGLVIQGAFTPTGGSPVSGIAPVVVPFGAMRQASLSGSGPTTVSLTLDYNLLSGIPVASVGPGTYSFTAYFVDGAGNRAATAVAQSGAITLTAIRPIKTELPLIRR